MHLADVFKKLTCEQLWASVAGEVVVPHPNQRTKAALTAFITEHLTPTIEKKTLRPAGETYHCTGLNIGSKVETGGPHTFGKKGISAGARRFRGLWRVSGTSMRGYPEVLLPRILRCNLKPCAATRCVCGVWT